VIPNTNGTLNTSANSISTANSSNIVKSVHAAGKKVLISVAGSATTFVPATSSNYLQTFTANLVNIMTNRGYDGIDIDWEPINSSDTNQFVTFITTLRTKMDAISPRPLLTAAVATQPATIGSLQSKFDQINIMTYDMSGTWAGWITWHNSCISNGGFRFPSTGGLLPSTEEMVNTFTNGGTPLSKLGIGLAFYGKVWSGGTGTPAGGATEPRQSWSNAPTVTTATYDSIMTTYYQSNLYHWDTNAQACYLSIDSASAANDKFISYDDERSCQSKVSFARNRRLGGIMIWELAEGYRPSLPVGQREPLLQSIKQALATPGVVSVSRSNQNLRLAFASSPLALYRVQWTSNLLSTNWSTLTNNLMAVGSSLSV
jgi:chitinase